MKQRNNKGAVFILMTLLIIATIVLPSFTSPGGCKKLDDGRYDVRFKQFPESDFVLRLNGNEFVKADKKGLQTKGTLVWIGDCYFMLSSDTVASENSIAAKFNSGLGPPCYQLTETSGRVTYFKLTRASNLNILLDEGKMKKID